MKTKNFKVRFGYNKNQTTATLVDREQKEDIATRFVKVREGDSYNKKDGRFFSFKKLMKHVAEKELLTKEQRTSMWNSFKENVTSNLVIR
jgi:hypothetical protein